MADDTAILADRLPVPTDGIAEFCRRWRVARLELFGSVLRPNDFGPDSDVDVMVTFVGGAAPTFLGMPSMNDELARLFGRPVDLMTRRSIVRAGNRFRQRAIFGTARTVYAD